MVRNRPLRVLLRRMGTEQYLQPSHQSRQQKLLGTEVVLAFAEATDHFVAMRVPRVVEADYQFGEAKGSKL